MRRTHTCGTLRAADDGQSVVLQGWIHRRRDLGGLIFLELRDREGLTQVVVEPDGGRPDAFATAGTLRSEWVVEVVGTVRRRPEGQRSARLATGDVEVVAEDLTVLSEAKTPPFPLEGSSDAGEVNEDLRLRHRYLDLRRPEALGPLRVRHTVIREIWRYLDERGFIQVETPMLTRSTPEGARDYVVPARGQPGHVYALPQSPQLFKQMLMMGGVDRYFQIARCFRDEDLRADRQPDFTQLDLEMAFVDQDDVLALNEGLMAAVVAAATGREVATPFLRLPHREALDRFGSDKPDVRFGLELTDLDALFAATEVRAFRGALDRGGAVRGLRLPAALAAGVSRKGIDDLEAVAKRHGAGGLAWLRRSGDGFGGPLAKALSSTRRRAWPTSATTATSGCWWPTAGRPPAPPWGRFGFGCATRSTSGSIPTPWRSCGSSTSRSWTRTRRRSPGRTCTTPSRAPATRTSSTWRPIPAGCGPGPTTSCSTAARSAADPCGSPGGRPGADVPGARVQP
jgi:aspartyl-tRNA synthetase